MTSLALLFSEVQIGIPKPFQVHKENDHNKIVCII